MSSLIFSGCQNNGPLSQFNRIARSWQNETSTVVSIATGQSKVTYQRGAAFYDVWMNLAPDGTYTSHFDNQSETGTWELAGDQIKLTTQGSSGTTYKLETVNSKELILILEAPADTNDGNLKAFLATINAISGLDISKGLKMTIKYSPR